MVMDCLESGPGALLRIVHHRCSGGTGESRLQGCVRTIFPLMVDHGMPTRTGGITSLLFRSRYTMAGDKAMSHLSRVGLESREPKIVDYLTDPTSL